MPLGEASSGIQLHRCKIPFRALAPTMLDLTRAEVIEGQKRGEEAEEVEGRG
jgi:hypothetical protein